MGLMGLLGRVSARVLGCDVVWTPDGQLFILRCCCCLFSFFSRPILLLPYHAHCLPSSSNHRQPSHSPSSSFLSASLCWTQLWFSRCGFANCTGRVRKMNEVGKLGFGLRVVIQPTSRRLITATVVAAEVSSLSGPG